MAEIEAKTLAVSRPRQQGSAMLLVLFVILVVLWVLGWLVFHVAGSLIHLLLLVAVVSLILHFVRGRAV